MAIPKTIQEIVNWRLCIGCGACAYACPDAKVSMVDAWEEGLRPQVANNDCDSCTDCLSVCPAFEVDYPKIRKAVDKAKGSTEFPETDSFGIAQEWGPVTGIWEGHATNNEIRFKGSSGGALTALSLYCLEREGMHGVLHIGQDTDNPIRNKTRLSRSRKEILANAGSRYSPASVCDSLDLVENSPSPCAVIGKPAEITAARKAALLRPALQSKIGVTLSFFCAETPSTAGTAKLLDVHNINYRDLKNLRYRGNGWPGHFSPVLKNKADPAFKMTYRESWAQLQASRPWATQIWPDGSGELADISCGDPWYQEPDGKNPGSSLIVTRTATGKRIVEAAVREGYLDLVSAEPWKVTKSQQGLLEKKRVIWGRLLAMKLFGIPTPKHLGMNLFTQWRKLSSKTKCISILGTIRRIITRKLYKKQNPSTTGRSL